jgi:hypothetical protein
MLNHMDYQILMYQDDQWLVMILILLHLNDEFLHICNTTNCDIGRMRIHCLHLVFYFENKSTKKFIRWISDRSRK